MSLQLAAQHLASHGRGDDKVLVHMTRGELKSLNDLAMAGGGHLTINPHTGLHEAGFLKAMLPMIIGAGLAAATGGTSLAVARKPRRQPSSCEAALSSSSKRPTARCMTPS